VPLGYDLKDGTPVVLKEEAERVRLIFRRYLEVSGINELVRDLRAKNICTKARTFSTGETRGGIPFGRGAFSYFLRNRFFIGEVKYKGEILPGEQPAILDKALFEAVQQKLSEHQSHKTLTRQKSDHLLKELLFDDAGHRMIATHATKAGVRYRYYASRPSLHGEAGTAKLGSVSRVPLSRLSRRSSRRFKNTSPHKTLRLSIATIRSSSTMTSLLHSFRASRCKRPNWPFR